MDPIKLAETVLQTSPQLFLVGVIMWIHYKIMGQMLDIIKALKKKDDTES